MDVLGALGGANRSFGLILGFFLIPFKYHIVASKMYSGLVMNYMNEREKNQFHKHNNPKYKFMASLKNIPRLDGTFNFFWYVHDKLKSCRLHNCFKSLTASCFKWDNFDRITALMKEIKSLDLELINLIDHDTTKVFQNKITGIFDRDTEGEAFKAGNHTKHDDKDKISEDFSLSDIYYQGNEEAEDKHQESFMKHAPIGSKNEGERSHIGVTYLLPGQEIYQR